MIIKRNCFIIFDTLFSKVFKRRPWKNMRVRAFTVSKIQTLSDCCMWERVKELQNNTIWFNGILHIKLPVSNILYIYIIFSIFQIENTVMNSQLLTDIVQKKYGTDNRVTSAIDYMQREVLAEFKIHNHCLRISVL